MKLNSLNISYMCHICDISPLRVKWALGGNKLRFYNTVKKTFAMEPYFRSAIQSETHKTKSQYHSLQIELGRHTQPCHLT